MMGIAMMPTSYMKESVDERICTGIRAGKKKESLLNSVIHFPCAFLVDPIPVYRVVYNLVNFTNIFKRCSEDQTYLLLL